VKSSSTADSNSFSNKKEANKGQKFGKGSDTFEYKAAKAAHLNPVGGKIQLTIIRRWGKIVRRREEKEWGEDTSSMRNWEPMAGPHPKINRQISLLKLGRWRQSEQKGNTLRKD